ncbi:MAG: acyl-CoA dehydrogenase family protein [Pseudomonadales bacterium]|nr:acyl-CoA dehydrogenase family protein [Pseudomonadales bacterium]
MEQSKNFGFGEDEVMLRDTARKLFADNCSADKIHGQLAQNYDPHREIECLWDKDLWKQIGELGWTAVCVPESAGGLGMPLVAAAALVEEAGKAAFPSPLVSTFNASFVLQACGSDAANKQLEKIAGGQASTLAITNQKGSWESSDTDVTVDDGTLNGTAWFVQDAKKAETLVVAAKGEKGLGLYCIAADDANVLIQADGIIDLTRDQAHIEFKGAKAIEVAAPGDGKVALDKAMPAILSIVSADMVGTSEWLLQTTVEYANTRVQFDRQLGFFQAVKHPLVNVMLDLDRAKSLTYHAACTFDEEPDGAELAARMAKSAASDVAAFSASRAIQFHGGIGFTWECYVHIFFKRNMHNHILYGDGNYQRMKLADILIGQAA